MKNVMFVGYGSMARKVHEMLPKNIVLSTVLASPRSAERIKAEIGESIDVITSVDDLVKIPDLAVEMSGQNGLKEHAIKILEKGIPLGIVSVGAFTDENFAVSLADVAEVQGVKIYILAGAVAGIDGINAASLAGLSDVVYQGRKHPSSWKGSHADQLIDYDNLVEPIVFFTGTAREAAALFPDNSNVAATIALAGVGLDDTTVELIADPTLEHNIHHIMAEGVFGKLEISMTGLPLAENPKTSSLAAFSALRLCCQIDQVIQI
ncbi:aspartate dehydrogenase [Psychrobacter frigidicola]|uniref:L-aspartate dehydrogenase n=1 Tax=Psychrobacter frigidicola TaxID=45611 RepID=A0A5C7A3C3_9GAMM|nr:aspartate dehydrogenase [Psychrobacter frigidicola]TXD98117.1 aspartate dehydrogenase [Psychrobacter frigidicola]